MEEPKTYLSMSTSTIDGKARYRVIHQAMPISADKTTPEEALRAAEQFRVKVSDTIWDGDRGRWIPPALSPAEVANLPVGSIVWRWVNGRVDGSPLVVIPGRKLTQIAILPERAGGQEPGGEPVAQWGREFVLVSEGRGKLTTHGTAQRVAEAWWQKQRRG